MLLIFFIFHKIPCPAPTLSPPPPLCRCLPKEGNQVGPLQCWPGPRHLGRNISFSKNTLLCFLFFLLILFKFDAVLVLVWFTLYKIYEYWHQTVAPWSFQTLTYTFLHTIYLIIYLNDSDKDNTKRCTYHRKMGNGNKCEYLIRLKSVWHLIWTWNFFYFIFPGIFIQNRNI